MRVVYLRPRRVLREYRHVRKVSGSGADRRCLPVPWTFGGVAALAKGSWLLASQVMAALGMAILVVWFLDKAWGSAVEGAIGALPAEGAVAQGRLHWSGTEPVLLHDNGWIALSVDPRGASDAQAPGSDLLVRFRLEEVDVRSPLGWMHRTYEPGWNLPLGRLDAAAAWAAWRIPLLLTLGLIVWVGLLVVWWTLSAFYAVPAWLVAWLSSRPADLGYCWKLAGWSLLPGCAVMALAIGGYASARLGFMGLFAAYLLHFVVGWVYLGGAFAGLA